MLHTASARIRRTRSMTEQFTSEAVTQGFRVRVAAQYSPEHSSPEEGRWLFVYHVTISNEGEAAARLISRHWIITDAEGRVKEVQGAGVVGEQPFLRPGDVFEYSSFCPLPTPVGSMYGSYRMRREDGGFFDIDIAPFTLAAPGVLQ